MTNFDSWHAFLSSAYRNNRRNL